MVVTWFDFPDCQSCAEIFSVQFASLSLVASFCFGFGFGFGFGVIFFVLVGAPLPLPLPFPLRSPWPLGLLFFWFSEASFVYGTVVSLTIHMKNFMQLNTYEFPSSVYEVSYERVVGLELGAGGEGDTDGVLARYGFS